MKFGEYVKMWNRACCSFMHARLMFNNDVEFIVNDLINCHQSFKIIYVVLFSRLVLECYLTPVVVWLTVCLFV